MAVAQGRFSHTTFTRLFAVTIAMKNRLHLHGKWRLGLGVPFLNGYCISTRVLAEVGWTALGVTEDYEYALHLAERGIYVDFACEAVAASVKATGFGEAYSQRVRWSSGQTDVARRIARPMLLKGIRSLDIRLADAALEVISPSYSVVGGLTVAAFAVCLALLGHGFSVLAWIAGALLAGQAAFFAAGIAFSGLGTKALASLALVPVFAAWRAVIAALALFGFGRSRWTRAKR